MKFFLVVHSLIILLHQHNAGQYLAIRKIQKLCFYDSRLKYTKIWNENILEGALPQKTDSDFSGSVHNNYSDHSFPPLSSSCPDPPPFLPPPRGWHRCIFKLEQMHLPYRVVFFRFFKYKFNFFCYYILPVSSLFDSTTFILWLHWNKEFWLKILVIKMYLS